MGWSDEEVSLFLTFHDVAHFVPEETIQVKTSKLNFTKENWTR